tara:strand:+ start:179 stop:622 length:444 start_codon:yes stop_codon:yes gene_type:complete
MMAGIGAKNTKPELLIRRGLFRLGYRYRLHGKSLPGKPDLVFASRKAVIFVNGCFWHGHDCHLFKWPKTRDQFWLDKIANNIRRDRKVRAELAEAGWRVCDVWECQIKGKERLPLETVLSRCSEFLDGNALRFSVGGEETVCISDEE